MKNLESDTTGSRQGEFIAVARSVLRNSLILTVVALWGCGQGPFEPEREQETQVRATPFSVQLTINRLGDQCVIAVNAQAWGGGKGSYAEWGHVEGTVFFDGGTMSLRPQELHPDVFSADRIGSGETQYGTLNLERFRPDPDLPVLVELEFHYRVWEDGASQGEKRVAERSDRCV